jgi:hypothetical chaperone protein
MQAEFIPTDRGHRSDFGHDSGAVQSRTAIGLDFGTTNSSLACASVESGGEPRVRLARYPTLGGVTASFRSLLYLEQRARPAGGLAAGVSTPGGSAGVSTWTGPAAIERYLEHAEHGVTEGQGRLIQSLKSYLPSRSLTGTEIFGRRYLLEDLISRILRDLREGAERQFSTPIDHVVVGRPVRFVGAETKEDDQYAVERLTRALELAGFASVEFEYEPVAAAYAYESTLDHDELLLIGDFGGGTSDFSLLRVGPSVRAEAHGRGKLLGTSGVGVAGDAFDAKLVRKLVSPALGAESLQKSLGKLLPAVPTWIYANLERWHYLSFLRTRNVLEILKGARVRALEPEKIDALLTLIDEDLGYQLHQAVQRVKYALSQQETAEFAFRDGSMDLHIPVTRAEFEGWIGDELRAIESSIDSLLAQTGVEAGEIDRVFLTGGTSFVPAVRRIFSSRFGEDRVRTGEAFTSVALGLALRGLDQGR